MMPRTNLSGPTTWAAAAAMVGIAISLTASGRPPSGRDGTAQASRVPRFQYDHTWPKPLPNLWRVGTVTGVRVDAEDHIWIAQRPNSLRPDERYAAEDPPAALCCKPAPPIIEFDQTGRVVRAWGGPGQGFDWPPYGEPGSTWGEHGVFADRQGFVWIGANASGAGQILKFTRDGKFALQIGAVGKSSRSVPRSADTSVLNAPTSMEVYPPTNELFVADGYGNRRVIVFDADTGAYKRHWGAYGKPPDDTVKWQPFKPSGPYPQQFNTVHGVTISRDGVVYIADRGNHRVQAFKIDGTFLAEVFVAPETRGGGNGTAHDVALSPDARQQFLYLGDGMNQKVWIIRRADLAVIGSFGHGGHEGGAFGHITAIATDSKGNLYVGETLEGKRVQRFKYVGMGAPQHD
jgi:hypothetical protein